MRRAILALFLVSSVALSADVESRVLTHYLPQDFLEAAVRTEGWTEVSLKVAGGLRKGPRPDLGQWRILPLRRRLSRS